MSVAAKKVVLRSSDGECFEVEESVAVVSLTIKDIREDNCSRSFISIPDVNSNTLCKVIDYCKKHVGIQNPNTEDVRIVDEEELMKWDKEFISVDHDVLFALNHAANYLKIKGLLDLICQTVADMIMGKSRAEIREILNIKDEFSWENQLAAPYVIILD